MPDKNLNLKPFVLFLFVNCISLHASLFGQIILNEVLAYPTTNQGMVPNGLEWIEVYNPTCNTIDISGYRVACKGPGTGGCMVYPAGTTIPPLGHKALGNGAGLVGPYCVNGNFVIQNIDGWIALYDPSGNPIQGIFWTSTQSKINNSGDADYGVQPCNQSGGNLASAYTINQSGLMTYVGGNPAAGQIFKRMPDGGAWQTGGSHTPNACNDPGNCPQVPVINASANPPTICQGESTVLSVTPTGYTYTWSSGQNGNNITVSPSTTTVYTVTVTGLPCANAVGDVTVTVNPKVTPVFNQLGPYCETSTTLVTLPTPSNNGVTGTWSPSSFTPIGLGPGTHIFNFTPATGQCADPTTMSIVVNPALTPTFNQLGPYCKNENITVNLPTSSTNGVTGIWSPSSFNPSLLGPGSHTFTFTPNPGQCAKTSTMTIVVNNEITPTFQAYGPYCALDNTTITLPTTSNNNINGTWNPASFNPNSLGTGNHTFVFTPAPGQCAATFTLTIIVNAPSTPVFNAYGPYCVLENTNISLPTTSNNNINGSWNPASFNPSSLGAGTHIFTFSPSSGQCANTATLTITVNPSIQPTFSQLGPYCALENIQITLPSSSNNGVSGSWQPASFNPSVLGAGTHTFIFTPNTGLCADQANMIINVEPAIVPTFNTPGPLCQNDSPVTLPTTSNNGISGTWSPTTINPSSGNDVTAVFTPNPGQCAMNQTLTVIVNKNPTINVIATCNGGINTGTLITNANAGENGNLTFTVNGIPSPDGNQTGLANGSYTVIVTESPGGCTASQTVNVNCNCPTITLSGKSTLCQDATADYTQTGGAASGTWSVIPSNAGIINSSGNFTASSTYTGDATIVYNDSGCSGIITITITDKTTPVFSGIGPLCQTSGTYALPSTSNNGITGKWIPALIDPSAGTQVSSTFTPDAGQCAKEITLTVDVIPAVLPVFNTVGPLCQNASSVLLPTTSLNGISGTWSPGNIDPSGGVDINSVFTPTTGQCALTNTLTIQINKIPTLTVTTDCGGGMGTGILNTTATPAVGGSLSYTINGNADPDGNEINLPNGPYSVIVTETPSGCTAEQIVNINCGCPTIVISGSASICQGSNADYLQTGGDPSGIWTISPANAGTIDNSGKLNSNANFTGTVTITYTALGCSGILVVSINAQTTPVFNPIGPFCAYEAIYTLPTTSVNGISGTWVPANIDPSLDMNIQAIFTPLNTLCELPISIDVQINSTPVLNATGDCLGGVNSGVINALALPAEGGIISYSINGTPDADGMLDNLINGTYLVIATETPSGCIVSNTININCGCPTITISGADKICQGNSVNFSQSGGNAGGIWTINPANAGSFSSSGNFTSSSTYVGSATINYLSMGCSGDFVLTILPEINADIQAIDPDCSSPNSGSIAINNLSGGDGIYTYKLNGNSINLPLNNLNAGNYNVSINDESGCQLSQDLVLDNPISWTLDLSADKTIISKNETVNLTATTSLSTVDIANISWTNTGTLSCQNCLNPTASPLTNTLYQITLTDNNGCTETAEVNIIVVDKYNVYIPNVFSLNSDGINDKFVIYTSDNIKQVRLLEIFDRWGERVFHQENFPPNDVAYGWDGKFRGKKASVEVYVYYAVLILDNGEEKLYKGDITVIR